MFVATVMLPAGPATAATYTTLGDVAATYAREHLVGRPYLWGYRGEDGFDCSGSAYLAWKHAVPGKVRNDWSARQYDGDGTRVYVGTGSRLKESALRAGDLLFWSRDGRTSGIYHVALYLGDGEILQTASGRTSWITSMNFNLSGRMPYALRPHGSTDRAPSAQYDAIAASKDDAYRVGDFDGDGRDDLLWFTGTTAPGASRAGWQIAHGTTSHTGRFIEALHSPVTPLDDTLAIVDVNADGRDDVLWFTGQTNARLAWTGWQVAYGTPQGLSALTEVAARGDAPAVSTLRFPLHGSATGPALDVPRTHQFVREISWLTTAGITTGYSDGTFRPSRDVSREAFAAFLYRLAGRPAVALPRRSPFSDVSRDSQFYREIVWLAQQGITTGWPDGTFRPRESIERNAMAAFLYRFEGAPAFVAPRSSRFDDMSTGSPFFREVSWLAARGITTGYSDGSFRPYGNVTREATAAFLFRMAAS